jgi:primary-amine oxidase
MRFGGLMGSDRWSRRCVIGLITGALGAATTFVSSPAARAQTTAAYPLDPLTRTEIDATVGVLSKSGKVHPATRIGSLTLTEPAKQDVLASARNGQSVSRAASIVLYDWATGIASRGVVDLGRREIISWADLPPADPPSLNLVIARATEIATADPRFRAAVARRGFSEQSRLRVEPDFSAGPSASAARKLVASDYVLRQRNGERVAAGSVFDRDASDMGSPRLATLGLWENLTRGTVDSVRDTGAVASSDAQPASQLARTVGSDPRPNHSTSSLDIHGTAIQWGRWRLRAAVDPRRGLELYDIGFLDQGRVRSILYRASISEMIAPYGDPNFGSWYPMDEGDVGLGSFGMTSAVPGEDAPATAVFVPAVFADDRGHAIELPRAFAVFERESGVQWRHGNTALRARELVVRGFCTADNYDYVFDWIFRKDGSIQVQASLTGIVNNRNAAEQHDTTAQSASSVMFSHLVAPGVSAPIHQHFFSYRLDFDIDRPDHNRVMQVTASGLPPGPDNARGEWFAARARTLRTESDALQDQTVSGWRQWRIISTRDTNAFGQPTGYALLPGEQVLPYPLPTSGPRSRAGFMGHELWVTPYNRDEMYAAGEVPSRDTTAQGLVRWTAANRPTDEQDVVLWYTLGVTHLPRTEDWPLMPTYTVGFRLVPAGFFSHDPAVDLGR